MGVWILHFFPYFLFFLVKIRKNVDRKASKCRRIRYNTHEKLVNFMAPVMGEVGDEGEEGGTIPRGLYTNLFR